MIKNAKIGDIVYLGQGHGPKMKIDHVIKCARVTFYFSRVIEPRNHPYLNKGDKVSRRAGEYSRIKKCAKDVIGKSCMVKCPRKVRGEGDYCDWHILEIEDNNAI